MIFIENTIEFSFIYIGLPVIDNFFMNFCDSFKHRIIAHVVLSNLGELITYTHPKSNIILVFLNIWMNQFTFCN